MGIMEPWSCFFVCVTGMINAIILLQGEQFFILMKITLVFFYFFIWGGGFLAIKIFISGLFYIAFLLVEKRRANIEASKVKFFFGEVMYLLLRKNKQRNRNAHNNLTKSETIRPICREMEANHAKDGEGEYQSQWEPQYTKLTGGHCCLYFASTLQGTREVR